MKKHIIINVGRQLGSGGRIIGNRIAEDFNIKFYDKELLDLAAKESGSLAVSALRIMRYCPNYFPVDPNPPSPRSVSFRVAAGTKAACHTGAMHSWATRSPGAMV